MNRDNFIASLKNDRRTKEEIFAEMIEQVKEICGKDMSDGEAANAVRNLLGYCETVLKINNESELEITSKTSRMANETVT